MPSELVVHPYLSAKNAGKWVNLQQYELFLRNSIGESVSKPRRVVYSDAGTVNTADSSLCLAGCHQGSLRRNQQQLK
jgi:hypothetical protein